MEEVKRIGRDLKYSGAIVDVYTDHMLMPNGNTAEDVYKRQDLETSNCAISLKTEIEKVREQIQNIE